MLFDSNADKIARERYNDLLREAEAFRRVKTLGRESGVQAAFNRMVQLLGHSANWLTFQRGSQERCSDVQAPARLQSKMQ